MSDFLMVVPPPWVEVSNDWIIHAPAEVEFWIEQGSWPDIDRVLLERDELPPGQHVVNARMFRVDGGYRIWVLFE